MYTFMGRVISTPDVLHYRIGGIDNPEIEHKPKPHYFTKG